MLETLLSNRTVSVLWEALPRILSAGLTMTIPLTLVSFTLAMVLAVAVALVQYAKVPVLSQLARFYIWVIRGTPLLVQLFIIFYGLPSVGIMLDAFPAAVIAFAFNEGAYCAETMLETLLSNRTVSVLWEALPRILSAGLTMTIPLTLVSFTLAMVLAVAVALVQYAKVPVLSQLARFYIWVIRGTPLLVQLFIIFYGLPSVGIMLDAFPAAVIAFAFNEGAYCAETMRGALESVPQGQLEAGYCVGMSWWQIMRRIVLPQALRTAVPALSNSLIGMIKDTSLASNITVAELFMAGQRVAARTYIFLPIYCEVAVVYLLFCTVITKLQGLLERQLNAHGFQ